MRINKWRSAVQFIGAGWYIVLAIAGCTLGGLWLDNRFDTKPIFILIGLFLGLMLAFYGVYRMVLVLMKDKEND